MAARSRRRPHGGTHSTLASEAPCRACRQPLLYAWDEGLLVRVDAAAVDAAVAGVLRGLGWAVYVLTQGRSLVLETPERAPLRLAVSRHVAHRCQGEAPTAPVGQQLGLFDLESVRPARESGGMW